MRVREELNKLKFYVHAAGGKRFKFEDKPSFFSLSGCRTTIHLLDHRHFHVLDVAVIGQIKMLGHGKTSSMIVGIMIVSFHRPKVLTKMVCKFTASFPNVQHVTSLAKDRVDHASGSTIEPLFEVNTSTRGSYRIRIDPEESINVLKSGNLTGHQILSNYKDVFEGLGRHIGDTTIITDPSDKPVQHAPRRVPVALRDKSKGQTG